MSTKTVNSSEITLKMIIQRTRNIEIDNAYDAVMWRSELNQIEAQIERLKGDCDEYLDNEFGVQKRITTLDNKYAVIRVSNNRSQYKPTFLLNLAKKILKWAESITPKEVKPVGRGYYYKASK